MSARSVHRAQAHRSALVGVEALSIVSDRAYPRHAHDHYGFGVIESGGHRSWSGVGVVDAAAGDAIMVNPGEIHDGAPVDGRPRGWRMLYLEPSVMAREMAQEASSPVEIVRPVAGDPALVRRFRRLFASITAPGSDILAVETDFQGCVAHLLARHGLRGPDRRRPAPPVARALERLDDAPERPTSLAELAGLSGVSRFQLLRGFRRDVGVTPYAYLIQRRLRLVKRLLGAGESPAQAATEAGFADQSHMTRAFVRQFGVTPSRYQAALG